jgi:hypothetical protein
MELAEVPGADPELARATARSVRAEQGPPALPWDAAWSSSAPRRCGPCAAGTWTSRDPRGACVLPSRPPAA